MKPIMQKQRHSEETIGDCLRACICSILEISDEGVPNFAEDPNYPHQLLAFLDERKLELMDSKDKPDNVDFMMGWGLSPRKLYHSVVLDRDGNLVHDPHPDGGGIEMLHIQYVWLEEAN